MAEVKAPKDATLRWFFKENVLVWKKVAGVAFNGLAWFSVDQVDLGVIFGGP